MYCYVGVIKEIFWQVNHLQVISFYTIIIFFSCYNIHKLGFVNTNKLSNKYAAHSKNKQLKPRFLERNATTSWYKDNYNSIITYN